ncbi:MAG: AmmeMemoRadiSam system protein B [Candidatus Abyssubacteria bacterium]
MMAGKLCRLCLALLFVPTILFPGCADSGNDSAMAQPHTALPQAVCIAAPPDVLRPSVAGMFYPSDSETLRSDVLRYLEQAETPELDGEIVAVLVPHAGYRYSGPVAAYAYKAIAEQVAKQKPEQRLAAVVVLAFSHRSDYDGVSVYYKGAMETPLGRAPVHERLARELMETNPCFSFSERPFVGEHSAEVQMPFLQVVLPDTPVVPVAFGRQTSDNIEAVSEGLKHVAEKNRILVVATTDLSHYHPYEIASSMDGEIIRAIVKGDPGEAAEFIEENYSRMHGPCGPGPVLAALSFAKSTGAVPVLLKYANSGDVTGDKGAVVGYAAIAFVKRKAGEQGADKSPVEEPSDAPYFLSEEDKNTLLRLARLSMESFVRDGQMIDVAPPASKALAENGAAFVTLKKDGNLRGCIGSMEARSPLYQTVIQMAVLAATQDPRFPPVRPEELEDIHIEVSVNTPLRQVSSADEIILGKHGVVVEQGLRRGLFLPQVATETGWTREEFLRNLCVHKAGLQPDAYKKDAKLYVFSSIVFEEKR